MNKILKVGMKELLSLYKVSTFFLHLIVHKKTSFKNKFYAS